MKLSDNYYTGREVQKLLNITEPQLRTMTKNETLRKVVPPGRQNGMYIKTEVDAFAAKWNTFLLAQEPVKATFSVATPEDMQPEYDLAHHVLGATMSVEQRQSWINKNPDCDYVVKMDDKVVAYLTLLPVKLETLQSFMRGEIRGWQITADEVETYQPDREYECIIMGTASDTTYSERTRMHFVYVLVEGINRELERLGSQGIKISKIYSTSETPTGITMSLRLGMEEIKPRLGKRMRFSLDVEQSDFFIFKNHLRALAEWNKSKKRNRRNPMSTDNKKEPLST